MDSPAAFRELLYSKSRSFQNSAIQIGIRFFPHPVYSGVISVCGSKIRHKNHFFQKRHARPACCVVTDSRYNLRILKFQNLFDICCAQNGMPKLFPPLFSTSVSIIPNCSMLFNCLSAGISFIQSWRIPAISAFLGSAPYFFASRRASAATLTEWRYRFSLKRGFIIFLPSSRVNFHFPLFRITHDDKYILPQQRAPFSQ